MRKIDVERALKLQADLNEEVEVEIQRLQSRLAKLEARPQEGVPITLEAAIALDEADRVHGGGEPHEFKGRLDRDCEVCGRPDRATVHSAQLEAQ